MALSTKHPLYVDAAKDWEVMRHSYKGERIVKEQGAKYLPPTSGMRLDGMSHGQAGLAAYNAYKTRASFPETVTDAVEAMLGVMHHKPAAIELPRALEPMRDNATPRKESLQMLLERINLQQLITGRVGMLLDLPRRPITGPVLPYIVLYDAENIFNWDIRRREEDKPQTPDFIVLDESEYERDTNFDWELVNKYRVLVLDGDTYKAGVFEDQHEGVNLASLVTPVVGGITLDEIPFVIANSKDIVFDPDDPPIVGLARIAMLIYRGEADYRQALFMQGQDTLIIIGDTEQKGNYRTGANAVISLGPGADAKYIGVDSQGLPEMREALVNDHTRASQKGGQLLENVGQERESGDALRIRVAARTATLNQLAITGAFALQELLRIEAKWVGANPEEVLVKPNLDFVDEALSGQTLVEYITAKTLGAPYSLKSIHKQMSDKGITEMSYEEELAAIAEEPELVPEPTDNTGEPSA